MQSSDAQAAKDIGYTELRLTVQWNADSPAAIPNRGDIAAAVDCAQLQSGSMDADLTRKLSYVALKQKIACHSITVELRSATKPGRFAVLGSRPFAVARRPSR